MALFGHKPLLKKGLEFKVCNATGLPPLNHCLGRGHYRPRRTRCVVASALPLQVSGDQLVLELFVVMRSRGVSLRKLLDGSRRTVLKNRSRYLCQDTHGVATCIGD
jgi:hypothetical protein